MSKPGSRPAHLLRRIAGIGLLLLCSLAASAITAEVAVRVYQFGLDSLWPPYMNSLHSFGESGLIQATDSTELIYELRPNLDTLYVKTPFRTNAEGMREDQEFSREKPADTFRVAVIGDSFTMPTGVAIDDAYHSVMEKTLNDRHDGPRYEFLNFGVAGYQLSSYLAVLQLKALDYDPDLILVAFSNNDHIHLKGMGGRRYQVKPVVYPFYQSHAWNLAKQVWETFRRKKPPRPTPDAGEQKIHFTVLPEHREIAIRELGQIAEVARAHDTPLVVVFLCHYTEGTEELLSLIEEARRRFGFAFVDASVPFPVKEDFSWRILRADGHSNAAANRIYGEFLLDSLTEQGLLPEGPALVGASSPRGSGDP
jgi:hypothetical protein